LHVAETFGPMAKGDPGTQKGMAYSTRELGKRVDGVNDCLDPVVEMLVEASARLEARALQMACGGCLSRNNGRLW
jgi:hypothetical protein